LIQFQNKTIWVVKHNPATLSITKQVSGCANSNVTHQVGTLDVLNHVFTMVGYFFLSASSNSRTLGSNSITNSLFIVLNCLVNSVTHATGTCEIKSENCQIKHLFGFLSFLNTVNIRTMVESTKSLDDVNMTPTCIPKPYIVVY
jgi:hypothetical protein